MKDYSTITSLKTRLVSNLLNFTYEAKQGDEQCALFFPSQFNKKVPNMGPVFNGMRAVCQSR